MNVAVLGYGAEGKSAAAYWSNLDHSVTVHDLNAEASIPERFERHLGGDYLEGLSKYDLIVRSPGIHPARIRQANAGLSAEKITSCTNEFLAECPARVIGVTGTKGKGTTSSLIAAMLKAGGHTVHLGGNIGIPPLDFLGDVDADDWVVLELSSFQLMDVRRSPHVAVMLMISPDHMEWHADMHEYLEAKQAIFKFQHEGDRAIYNACNIYSLASGLEAPADQMLYNSQDGAWVDDDCIKLGGQTICTTDEITLAGAHNRDNVCAAVAATWPILEDVAPIKAAIASFSGLDHRLERIAEVDGVTYYDDSISTNPETAIGAINAFTQPKVVILGGSDKGASFERLAREVTHANVRAAILIGSTSPELKAALDKSGYEHTLLATGIMDDVVALAAQHAEPGDVVLLSPACASFDQFKNYKDRGNQFQKAVKNL